MANKQMNGNKAAATNAKTSKSGTSVNVLNGQNQIGRVKLEFRKIKSSNRCLTDCQYS